MRARGGRPSGADVAAVIEEAETGPTTGSTSNASTTSVGLAVEAAAARTGEPAPPPGTDRASRRAGWRLIGSTVRPMKRTVLAGCLFGLLWTSAKVSVPKLTGFAIDRGVVANDHGALLLWTLLILSAGLVAGVNTGLRRYNAFKISYTVETEIRSRLFAHLQRLHFGFHDQAQTGQLMARAATDLQQINQFVVLIPITLSNAVTVVAITTVLLLVNAKLALLALGTLPLVNIFAKRFSSRVHPASMALQGELAELATVVEETVTGIRVVKGFGAEGIQTNRLERRGDLVFDRAVNVARIRGTFNPILDFFPALGLAAVLWYGGHAVLRGDLSLGQLVQFNVYVAMLVTPLRMTGQLVAQAQRAVAAASRIDQVLATDPAIADPADPRPLPAGGGDVRFDDVTFGYLPGTTVLDGLDLHVRAGEAVAIVGATGSGKSTIARLIPRFYDLDGGRVLLDGADVRDLRLRELRQQVGIVFEDTFLFSDSVRGNIAFANPMADESAIERAARLAGAHDFILALPEGYDTVLGERGFSLSGGQRQRLALARAILANPRVLILDDATSAVDPTKEHEIRAALEEVMRGRTTLVIAHRPATIALADRVVLLDGGRIVAEGTHERLLATNLRYQEVLAQAEDRDHDTEEVGA